MKLSIFILCAIGLLSMFLFQSTNGAGISLLSTASGVVTGISFFVAGAIWLKDS